MKAWVSSISCIILGIWVWYYSTTFPGLDDGHPGPALFPRLIALSLVLSGLSLMLSAHRQHRMKAGSDQATTLSQWGRLSGGIVAALLFPVLQSNIGFIASLSILSILIALMLRARIRVAVPLGIVSAGLIYWVFTGLLGVPL